MADAVSPWVERFLPLLPPGGQVLDVAAGRGRHTRALRRAGHTVIAVDRDTAGLTDLRDDPAVELVEADLEAAPWPLPDRSFDGVVVTNYLHRPLFPWLLDALRPDGVLIYETYARGQERFGRPTNPEFLLRPGELLEVVRDRLTVVAYEDLLVARPARIQRLAAVSGAVPTDRAVGT